MAAPLPDLEYLPPLLPPKQTLRPGPGESDKSEGVGKVLPAAEAAEGGDLILEFAKRRFRRDDTVAALMAAHREILQGKFGNRLPVVVLRNKKPVELFINLR